MYALYSKWTRTTIKVTFVEISEDTEIKKSILQKLKEDNEGTLFGFCGEIEFIDKNPAKRSFYNFEDYITPYVFFKNYYSWSHEKESFRVKHLGIEYYLKLYNSISEDEFKYLFQFWKEKYSTTKKLTAAKKSNYSKYLEIIKVLEDNDYINNSIICQIIT